VSTLLAVVKFLGVVVAGVSKVESENGVISNTIKLKNGVACQARRSLRVLSLMENNNFTKRLASNTLKELYN
jgi:hypothetical protein